MPDRFPVDVSSSESVSSRAELARGAQGVWRRYSLSQRIERLRALWKEISRVRPRLASVIHEETGEPLAEIEMLEFAGSELLLNYYTRNAHRMLRDRAVQRPWPLINKRAYTRHAPRGLVGVITPRSLPLLLPWGDVLPALLAGNGVLLKPSEGCRRTALCLEEAVRASGLLPEHLFQAVPGDDGVGAAVVQEADMILFSGTAASGRRVAEAAARRLIPAVLWLGGKPAMIVLRDAPIERACKAAVWGAFAHGGRLRFGVQRVFVEGSAYAPFCEAVSLQTARLRQGVAFGYDADLGRLATPERMRLLAEHLQDAREKGGRVTGGEVLDERRLVVSPALVLDASVEMRIMREEASGPVLPVLPVRTAQEALVQANSTPSGLSASVWSLDVARAEARGARVDSGLVSVNDLPVPPIVCSLPFGGVRESGLGSRYSDEGLRMFCRQQAVWVHEWPGGVSEPVWFPYSRSKVRLFSLLARWS